MRAKNWVTCVNGVVDVEGTIVWCEYKRKYRLTGSSFIFFNEKKMNNIGFPFPHHFTIFAFENSIHQTPLCASVSCPVWVRKILSDALTPMVEVQWLNWHENQFFTSFHSTKWVQLKSEPSFGELLIKFHARLRLLTFMTAATWLMEFYVSCQSIRRFMYLVQQTLEHFHGFVCGSWVESF